MRIWPVAITVLTFFFAFSATAQILLTRDVEIESDLILRVGVMSTLDAPPQADVIYLHGFSDRFDQHQTLFREFVSQGFRVISFDLPSHGETRSNSLDCYSFGEIAEMIRYVERSTREKTERPLYLVGWSAGGLLAVRMAQEGIFAQWDRQPQALVLHAPGVALYPLPGEWGIVTRGSLTSNKEAFYMGPPKPLSPFLKPIFSARMFYHSFMAGFGTLPEGLPVLTIVAGDRADRYTISAGIRNWVNHQREKQVGEDLLLGVHCPEAKHELDNEVAPIGETVRAFTTSFLSAVLNSDLSAFEKLELPGCQRF